MQVKQKYSRIRRSIQGKIKEKVNMKERLLTKGLTTTLLGVCVLVFCGVLIYQGKQTASDLSGWFAFSLTLLRAKDSLLFGEPTE